VNISVAALQAPTLDTIDGWLNTPRLARCGELFVPSDPMWRPDRSTRNAVNWQSALLCVSPDKRQWLHGALAYRMSEAAQGSVVMLASMLSRASKAGFDPFNAEHLVDLRDRFTSTEFSSLAAFMYFWGTCESLAIRPSQELLDDYKSLPRKKKTGGDVILSLDPEKGPFLKAEQDALYQWAHEQFSHGTLDVEQYIYLRIAMVYGQRAVQMRMMVFNDFVEAGHECSIRICWAKRKDEDAEWREKFETFYLDKDFYRVVQKYKSIVLAMLEREYPGRADWGKAIGNVPLFRRKYDFKNDGKKVPPVLVDRPDYRSLESAPDRQYHADSKYVSNWLSRMETMPGFPVSQRTGRPLKISRGHRFRHTLGTDLSNAGLDEWSIATALMHSNTSTVRKYRQVSAELMQLVDQKLSDHLALVVGAFTGTIVTDRAVAKNGERADRQIEDLAVCGADRVCYLDAPFTCYGCVAFQPLLDADHSAALTRLEQRRAQVFDIDKTTAVVWDRAILACRKVILDCKAMQGLSDEEGSVR